MTIALFLGLTLFFGLAGGIFLVLLLNILYRNKPKTAPVGGGIFLNVAIAICFLMAVPILRYIGIYTTSTYPITTQMHVLVLPLLMFLPSSKKMYQILVTAAYSIFLYANIQIPWVYIPIVNVNLVIGWMIIPIIAVLMYLGSRGFEKINAIDGLPLGALIVTLIGVWAVSHDTLDTVASIFLSAWIGVSIAVQYFQFTPARIRLEVTSLRSQAAVLVVFSWLIGKPIAIALLSGFIYANALVPLLGYTQKHAWPDSRTMFRGWLICLVCVLVGLWASFI